MLLLGARGVSLAPLELLERHERRGRYPPATRRPAWRPATARSPARSSAASHLRGDDHLRVPARISELLVAAVVARLLVVVVASGGGWPQLAEVRRRPVRQCPEGAADTVRDLVRRAEDVLLGYRPLEVLAGRVLNARRGVVGVESAVVLMRCRHLDLLPHVSCPSWSVPAAEAVTLAGLRLERYRCPH